MEESGVAGKLVEVELAPNVLLLVRDDGNKGVKAAVVEIEPTTVVEDMFQFFQNSDTVPLSLSLFVRIFVVIQTASISIARLCANVAVTLMDPT